MWRLGDHGPIGKHNRYLNHSFGRRLGGGLHHVPCDGADVGQSGEVIDIQCALAVAYRNIGWVWERIDLGEKCHHYK